MLLAGIKAGKKKKKKSSSNGSDSKPAGSSSSVGQNVSLSSAGHNEVAPSGQKDTKQQGDHSRHAASSSSSSKPPAPAAVALAATAARSLAANNESLAEQLRQSFRQGKSILPTAVVQKSKQPSSLEDRGRILLEGSKPQRAVASLKRDVDDDDDDDQKQVVIMGVAASLKNKQKNDQDLAIADMVAQERLDSTNQNEATAREILRMNKRRKLKKNVDSDEEEERQLQTIGMAKDDSKKAAVGDKKPPTARQERQEQRQEQALQQRAVARHDAQEQIIAKCWWWMEAKLSFQRQSLLALGNFVSLVMTPPSLSVVPGHHFYLVPIRHASCFLTCDEDVWQEVRYFQSSLRAMYASKNKSVIFTETVLSTSSFWQTRMECIVVPAEVAMDAPLYFKNNMLEQAEEWGTHSHKIYNINQDKTLVHTLPSKASNLAYFYIDFGSNNDNNTTITTPTTTGYAQVIESSRFPKDFASDTVAGMMHLDPMRLRRGGRKPTPRGRGQKGQGDNNADNDEQGLIRTFLQEWKEFDWTLQLDES